MRTWLVPLLMIPLTLGCGDKVVEVIESEVEDCDDGFGRAADGNCYPIDSTVADSGTPDGTDSAEPTDTATPTDSAAPTDTAGDTGDSGIAPPIDEDGDGYSVIDGDCDDSDPAIHPDADELCDRVDNDCDGSIDEDPTDGVYSYIDVDADGYGDDRFAEYGCEPAPGHVLTGGDCNDASASTHPDALERCDDEDNDCDDEIDEDVMHTWYADTDGDGYGSADASVDACDPGPGYVASSTDCDDTDPASHPGALEVCDGIDNNCNDDIDDSAIDATNWYADADGDGYGDGAAERACEAPESHVATDGDCNDGDGAIHPGATEVCDDADTDEDCSGTADDADGGVVTAGMSLWYPDADGDGFGDVDYGIARCDAPEGHIDSATDCDDTRDTVNPDATETCNGLDDDCDGITDEADATDAGTWYADTDGDGYGNPDAFELACSAPAGHVANDTDCDDTRASVSPAGIEACNELDDDCDGTTDEDDAVDASTWYADTDSDTYGNPTATARACTVPDGYVADATDCDDTRDSVSPAGTETCNERDDDCDGTTDEDDATDAATWFIDGDGDGYGIDDLTTASCTQPEGYVADSGDCDDTQGDTYPGAEELCDAIDNDCDDTIDNGLAEVTFYLDDDEDGYGNPDVTIVACATPAGYAEVGDDCNDDSADIHPDAAETCTDAIDNNCDGSTDCEDGVSCKPVEPTCWVCGDSVEDPGEGCDDGNTADGDGCSSTCTVETVPIDTSGLHGSWSYDGREVYVWQSDSRPITEYDTFCQERGLNWFTPDSAGDAQNTITTLDGWDSNPTWVITKNNTTKGSTATWGGYSVTVDSPDCMNDSSSGFSAIRRWGCSMCDPDSPGSHGYSGTTSCWDSNSYDWLVCEE